MVNAVVKRGKRNQVSRKIVGELSGGEQFTGMNTSFFNGGQQVLENLYVESGRLAKMSGNTLFKAIPGFTTTSPQDIFQYIKSDGSKQVLALMYNGTTYNLRAVEADGTLVTPTGGAGDVAFTSGLFSFYQIGNTGFIINTSATTPGYSWNGTLLTATTNLPVAPIFLGRDGNRLVAGYADTVEFSGIGIAASNDFTAGAGAGAYGQYNLTIRPTAGVRAGSGMIIFGETGAEAHFVSVNSASDDVSSETKITAFSYTGQGVTSPYHVAAGETFVYFVNSAGLFKMNPYSGETTGLVDDKGSINQYWQNLDITSSKVVYSPKERAIVVSIAESGGSNSRLLCYYEDTGVLAFKTRVYATGLGVVDNQLYSGEYGGELIKIFNDGVYSDKDSAVIPSRVIEEWTGHPHIERAIRRLGIAMNLNPEATATLSIYLNGSTTFAYSETFTLEDSAVNSSSTVSEIGNYIMGCGTENSNLNANTDFVTRGKFLSGAITYAVELVEESTEDFDLYSYFVDTSTRNIDTLNTTLSNQLFTLSS